MAVPARWALLIVALQPLADIRPPVDVLDLFAGPRGGGCGVAKACRAENLAALTYDCLHDPINQDVLNPRGLETLILFLLRVKPEGLVVLGPPCSNWIGLSLFRHGRTRLSLVATQLSPRCASPTPLLKSLRKCCSSVMRVAWLISSSSPARQSSSTTPRWRRLLRPG